MLADGDVFVQRYFTYGAFFSFFLFVHVCVSLVLFHVVYTTTRFPTLAEDGSDLTT